MAAALCGGVASDLAAAPAWNYRVLHTQAGPTDGLTPVASLVEDTDGNFYGTTSAGGPFNSGTIFRQTPSGVLTTIYSFTGGNDGGAPTASLVRGNDGNFYGATSIGGGSNAGTIYRITPTGNLTTLYVFTGGNDGQKPGSALTQGTDDNFYGVTAYGGTAGSGTIFKVTPAGSLTTLHSFTPADDGWLPQASLVQGNDGNFYGTTSFDGPGGGQGTVFRCSPTGEYTVLHGFGDVPDGSMPQAALVQGADGNFYGTTTGGGASTVGGTIFKITPTGTLTILVSFNFDNGALPQAGLVQGNDGNFYGTAAYDNPVGNGTVFKVTPDGTLTTVYQFNAGDGATPEAALVLGRDGRFYGTTAYGGNAGGGIVFALSADGAFTSLHRFVHGDDGANPSGPLLLANDGSLYGVTANGGPMNKGTAFRVGRAGTQTVLATFGGDTGVAPTGALVQGIDGNFYGVTSNGGAADGGTVFRMTPAGALTAIHSFNGDTEGMFPSGGLLLASDGDFYGVTSNGGTGYVGTVFKVTAQGALTVLHSFAYDTNGSNPVGPLVQGSDGNFYGSLSSDSNFTGHIFRLTPDGTVTLLHDFSSDLEGYSPNGGLVRGSDGSFYGTVDDGGPAGGGTLFKITMDGAFSVLHAFDPDTDGSDPAGGLALAANGSLYGTASSGGPNDLGTIYELTAGGTFSVLHTFDALGASQNNHDGSNPSSALIRDADGNLYGVATNGGAAGLGTVFALSPAHPGFFNGEAALANGVYYLQFPSGNPFGYYSYLADPHYIYHFDLGYEYVFDAADGNSGVYLYDFKSGGFFYTSPGFPFPYLYDFALSSVVYYYPDPDNPGRYNTDGYRFFYVFGTGQIISK